MYEYLFEFGNPCGKYWVLFLAILTIRKSRKLKIIMATRNQFPKITGLGQMGLRVVQMSLKIGI